MTSREQQHTDVGAYALGVLDDVDATRFEEHLADCPSCAAQLDDLMGLPPLLADFAAGGGSVGPADPAFVAAPGPGPELLDRLLGEVAATRRTARRRRLYLVAAAAALIIGGPAVATVVSSDDGAGDRAIAGPAMAMYQQGEKIGRTDPTTKVAATVSMEQKPWGTHVALKLGNVKGPLKCDLVAVSKSGEEQTVTTWAVPKWGYGVPGGKGDKGNKEPFYAHGGAALDRNDIDHFEVRTLDGRRLVRVPV
ncbi:anti-sigma factor family protein [Streptomyces sp. H27-D2]|uniref:anti-sigma factor family protein n=1 Tax=Streptomyces sp. H27-D2 TaxID=3046304 RepID=UPI002DBF4B21|nr:zf-HC2 domain-containing protein [Streptomyces sp. H27-D2]MEC4015088.1 zf-HC2 domain-containing protein [Streptomyces sp. H27-D2]